MRRTAKVRVLWLSLTGRVLFALLLLWAASERAAHATTSLLSDGGAERLDLRHSVQAITTNLSAAESHTGIRVAVLGLALVLACGMFLLLVRKTQDHGQRSNEALA